MLNKIKNQNKAEIDDGVMSDSRLAVLGRGLMATAGFGPGSEAAVPELLGERHSALDILRRPFVRPVVLGLGMLVVGTATGGALAARRR